MTHTQIRSLTVAILLIFAVSVCLFVYWPSGGQDASISGALALSIVTLGGLALIVALMAGLVTVFNALELSDKRYALGLPEGSIRSLIAFSLVLAFVCLSSFLYSSTNAPELTKAGMDPRASGEKLKTLQKNFVVIYEPLKTKEGAPELAPDGKSPLYDVTFFSKRDKGADDFAKQIFTTLATVFVSVVSFYFGSSTILAVTKQNQSPPPADDANSDQTGGGKTGDDKNDGGNTNGDNTEGDKADGDKTGVNDDKIGGDEAAVPRGLLQQASFFSTAVLPKFGQSVVDAGHSLTLGAATDLSAIFGDPLDFFKWYNDTFAGVEEMKSRYPCADSDLKRQRFAAFWDEIPVAFGTARISAIEFCALMAVNLEESNGNMSSAPEQMNKNTAPHHPGLAYAFDKIPNAKQSYNLGQNQPALSLFNNPLFVEAHKHRGGAKAVLERPGGIDPRWGGDQWPAGVRADVDEAMNGFIMEADFYKFRGRGIIQTTWRSDYKLLIKWILSAEASANITLAQLAAKWKTATPTLTGDAQIDAIATISSNEDWDAAFGETLTLAKGIKIDSDAKNKYLVSLATDAGVLQAGRKTRGSFLYFAAHINGGDYPDRVAPKMEALLRGIAESIGAVAVARTSRAPEVIEV